MRLVRVIVAQRCALAGQADLLAARCRLFPNTLTACLANDISAALQRLRLPLLRIKTCHDDMRGARALWARRRGATRYGSYTIAAHHHRLSLVAL